MSEVGIRELKAKASKIIDEVREHAARYTITRRGRPVAVLLPVEEAPADVVGSAQGTAAEETWQRLELLGEEIGRGWQGGESSGALLEQMRR